MQKNSRKDLIVKTILYTLLFLLPTLISLIIGLTTPKDNHQNIKFVLSTLGIFAIVYLLIFSIRVLRRQKEVFSYSKKPEKEVKKAIEKGEYTPGIRFSQVMFFLAAIILIIICIIIGSIKGWQL